ncbi:MAG: hypothetical protein IJD22_07355, partial [Clostridia bacterium]|nr:hypothetical protein [Clostridia bacterium]
MNKKREHFFRYVAIGAFYVIICLIFVARLINIQIAGQDYYTEAYHDGYYYRTVPIQAQRGEIFDRNGKALVSNEYTYSLYLDAGSLTADENEKNLFILRLLDTAEALGEADGFSLPEQPFVYSDGEWELDRVFMATAYGKRFSRLLGDLGYEKDK